MEDILLTEFLNLRDFEEYMERFPDFCGLKMGADTLRKEMELMERDKTRTHRGKGSNPGEKDDRRTLRAENRALAARGIEGGGNR